MYMYMLDIHSEEYSDDQINFQIYPILFLFWKSILLRLIKALTAMFTR